MEMKNYNTLRLLDVLQTRLSNCGLRYSVYRKPTHIDIYLHANSHHQRTQKLSVVNALIDQKIVTMTGVIFRKLSLR